MHYSPESAVHINEFVQENDDRIHHDIYELLWNYRIE